MAVGSSRACHNGCLCLGAMVLHGLTERELPYTQPCAHRRLTAACGWMDRASRLCAQAAERSCRSPQPGQGVRAHWAASGVRAVSRQDRPHGLPQASHQARAVRHTPPSVTSSRSSTDCAHAHELASALHPRRAALWVRGWVRACVCVGGCVCGWMGGRQVCLVDRCARVLRCAHQARCGRCQSSARSGRSLRPVRHGRYVHSNCATHCSGQRTQLWCRTFAVSSASCAD
jgi:hypothetical protein